MIANERSNLEQLAVHLALHKEFARHLVSGSIPQARANLAARLEEAEEALVSQVALLQL
jgi:hypothetical protein